MCMPKCLPKKLVNCNYCNNELKRYQTKTNTHFCNNICKGNWQIKQREDLGFTKDWLISQYIDMRKGADRIAREIGRDPKRVWEWLKNYGIPVRPRGTDYGQCFKKGYRGSVGRKLTDAHKEILRQARLKDGHVPYLKDGKHWLHHPGMKSPNWKGGISPERQSVYSSLQWKDAVKIVWERDNHTCQICGIHQNESMDKKFHIHHIVSFHIKELQCEVSNLTLLCPKCHKTKHTKRIRR